LVAGRCNDLGHIRVKPSGNPSDDWDWIPPVIVAITATKIIVTHAGFNGSARTSLA